MDGLLTAVKTINRDSESPLVAVETQTRNDAFIKPAVDLSQDISSQQLVQILKSHPGNDELAAALASLDPFNESRKINELDIRTPGPTAAQILQVLVSTTIPDHWAFLNGKDSKAKDAKCRAALLRCLSSIAGIGSLVAQLRTLIASSRAAAHKAEGSNNRLMIRDLLSVLAALLEPKDFLSRIFADIVSLHESRTRQQVAWREFVSLVAAGKILSTAAEALTVANASEPISSVSWIGDGPRYATWLGANIAHLASKIKVDDVNDWTSLAFLTGRALSLGYAGKLLPVSPSHDKNLTFPRSAGPRDLLGIAF
jgi:telomere length regulation protein